MGAGYSQDQDDSFFTTTAYSERRAFNEIVSSVQGTFNFLQDSTIESPNCTFPLGLFSTHLHQPSGGETLWK